MNTYYERTAQSVAQITTNVLFQRPGTDPSAVSKWLLTETPQGDVWLFAELDDQRIARFEPYEKACHHLSSSLRGLPVLISNHTGLRYAFLLSPIRKLPKHIDLPDELRPGFLLLGQRASGGQAFGKWGSLGHILVAGISGGGKSYTLRTIVYQALAQGFNLILGDLDITTFQELEHHPALITDMVHDDNGFIAALGAALAELERRKELFSQADSHPENIEEYNRWALANGKQPLKRLLVCLDEFNTAIDNTGGADGPLLNLTKNIVRRGRKFGITMVIGSQDLSKDIFGRVRDQIGTMIVHRMQNADVARNLGMTAAAQISPNCQGRALTDRWGRIQVYFLDKSRLQMTDEAETRISVGDRQIAERALRETEGKISLDVLIGWGMGQGEARRLQEDWKSRGWARNDPKQSNGLYITPKLAESLTNLQTLQTPTNRLQTLQTQPTNLQTQPTNLQTDLQTQQTNEEQSHD
jgi:hypothetical protein